MYDVSELENLSEKLYANVEGWENGALQRIGKRVNEIGRLSVADAQALNNMALVKGDLKVIYRELAEVTGKNIAEIEKIYGGAINEIHNDNKLLYDYRNKPFIPFEENTKLRAMVRAYARATAADMINLGKTKMLRTFDKTTNKTVSVDKAYKAVLDKAVVEVSSGASDFHSSMRSCLKALGGNGIRVDYGGGVTRRLDTVVRQNLLWGAKQTFMEYSDIIGEEIGADGIEITAHLYCRPSHEFMQGQQYILGKGRMIDGEYFESADRALEALQDYNCNHHPFSIICGVSVPMHSKEELAELHRRNTEKINIDGVEKTGYEWKQSMRQLETKTRQLKGEREILRAAGDKDGARQINANINAIKDKYTKIGEKSGNELRYNRMSVVRKDKGLTKGGSGGIIKGEIQIGRSLGAAAFRDNVLLPSGNKGKIQEGSKITKVVVFAGKGTKKELRVANHLAKQYNVPEGEWQHVRGDGYVVCDDGVIRHAELHWFESDKTGRIKMKVKRYFDD